MVPGWVYRVGIGEGYTGVLPTDRGEALQTAERAPEGPAGAWSGWSVGLGAPAGPGTTPSGPGRHPAGTSLYLAQLPGNAASWPIRARFGSIYLKVSQNGQVSPKSCQKAYVSPYFQNGLRKSALGIPRFPFYAAFSHKELMGGFDPCT